jgi:hypothetical protein
MRAIRSHVGSAAIAHHHFQGFRFVGKGILPASPHGRHHRGARLRSLAAGGFGAIEAVLGEVHAVIGKREHPQFALSQPGFEQQVVLVVVHGRGDVDGPAEEGNHTVALRHDDRLRGVLLEKCVGEHVELAAPQADPAPGHVDGSGNSGVAPGYEHH